MQDKEKGIEIKIKLTFEQYRTLKKICKESNADLDDALHDIIMDGVRFFVKDINSLIAKKKNAA